eukprot:Ihof_evm9s281 gene=Ihof_evmTU9s281
MDAKNLQLAQALVPSTYIRQGADSMATRRGLVRVLLSQRRLPDEGWDDMTIELLLTDLAQMDSNNFP